MENSDKNKFYLTQSAIKDFEREDTCPFRWKSQWIDKNPDFKIKNENLDRGSYFEYLVLGGGATEQVVTDLPRLQNGSKSIDQIRIEEQAARVKDILFNKESPDYLGFKFVNSQVEIKFKDRKGTLDIIMEEEIQPLETQPWVIDLKLTKDLTSDRTKYGYGNDWSMLDLLQQVHYEDLYFQKYGRIPKLGLLVADYSPQKRIEFGEIILSQDKRNNKNHRFEAAEEAIGLYHQYGWIKIPSLPECAACKLECETRFREGMLVKKVINY